jgi:muramoyltetrapeptide carboxypeptidase
MISPLRPGDCVAFVAPSSPFEIEKFYQAVSIFESRGYRVAPGKNILQKRGYLAGTEAERAEDLIHAILDPSVSAIVCIRGGFGSSRLLPWLPFSAFKQTPKIFLGYSDATFLHVAFWTKNRWVTFHGSNLIESVVVPESLDAILSALSGNSDFSWSLDERNILRHGMASGIVLGGNLCCLCHLLGTPYFPDLRGVVLLLEDRGEALYRLDRILTQFKLAGVFDQIAGLILGHFRECDEPQKIRDMVLDQVKYYTFPVVADLPFGHGSPNQVIPLGSEFLLNTYEQSLRIVNHPFATGAVADGAGTNP